jgi:hypothetical protein
VERTVDNGVSVDGPPIGAPDIIADVEVVTGASAIADAGGGVIADGGVSLAIASPTKCPELPKIVTINQNADSSSIYVKKMPTKNPKP